MDGRKVNGVILRACCSPAPILSGPFRFLRNILASWKIYRAVSKYPSKISPKVTAKNLSELSNHRSTRSEEHTSELQSPDHLVCRLLLEKKKKNTQQRYTSI